MSPATPDKPADQPRDAGGRKSHLRPEWILRRMWETYWQLCRDQVESAAERAAEGLRRRKDGTPSAVPPRAVVPLSLWAVYEDVPDGGDDEDVENRLANYEFWLRRLKRNGLYDGPVTLKRVNDEE